ncbi:MAG: hypothetical protein ACJ77M_05850 [Thermoleophilaceae bacterium]
MTVRDSAGGGELPEGFLDLPHEVYRDDPNWIPEDRDAVAMRFSASNTWFEYGEGHAFSVPRRTRAAAFRTRDLVVDGVPAAFFGYWESLGDQDADADVMDAVRAWAREHGAVRLFGPINFSTASDYRVRLWDAGGGDERPLIGEPYNPASYPAQLEALGFQVRYRFYTYVLDVDDIRKLHDDKRELLDEARARGYRFEPLTVERWLDCVHGIYDAANAAFQDNFAFVPFTREQFEAHFDASWAATLHPDASVIVYGPAGDVAGCFMIYPDYAPLAVQAAGDSRVPVTRLNFPEHGALLDPLGVVFKTGAIHPDHRRANLAHAMTADAARRAREAGATTLYGGLIREDNPSGRVYKSGWTGQRWYALYAADV